MKNFIKNKLNEFLNEIVPLNVPNVAGTKADVELAKVLQAKPYFELLQAVRADWGKDSDLYQALVPLYISDKFDLKKIKGVLDYFDVYKHFLSLNETK